MMPADARTAARASGRSPTLAGTLTKPPRRGPHPAALLITGSGPHDRDETVAGHRPFLVLADYLTRRDIAVLRADDRGVGGSTGDFASAATFAPAAVEVIADWIGRHRRNLP
jgi:uncharacterized protein